MTELKRSVDRDSLKSIASKRQKVDLSMYNKERKEKIGERITALQQLVSPFGKTDTASVLLAAMDYIKFLHEQLKVLSAPYLHDMTTDSLKGCGQYSLRNKGLSLMPTSYTDGLPGTNGADIWAPTKSGSVDGMILGKEERV